MDQITKLIFSTRDFFIGPIHFHPLKNYGLVFSLNFGPLLNLILIAAAVIFFIGYYIRHRQQMSRIDQLTAWMIFAGAISNIIDRLYLEFVRDFLDVGLGFTFNLADVFVVIGVIILFLLPHTGDKIAN
jgi:signal peptidase II